MERHGIALRVLVTGFEPFGGDTVNTSGEAVTRLPERWDEPEIDLRTAILPVTFAGAPVALAEAIDKHQPDAVICVGEAGGRTAITPELVAVNRREARIPDNEGAQPSGPIDDGPATLASRLDVAAAVAAIQSAGVPAEASEDAGAFVCNATFRAALTQFDGPAGFIHVPAVRDDGPALVGAETDDAAPADSGLTVDQIVVGLKAVVRSVLVSMGPWHAST